MNKKLLSYLKESGEAVLSYYKANPYFALTPAELMEGCFVYFERGGKRLRPAICRLAAGVLGGKRAEEEATPCALALELYHNWTLIHDDMIDHDDTRRGKPAVHRLIADRLKENFSEEQAEEYAHAAALLSGDALHSAAIYYLSCLSDSGFVPPKVALEIISLLEGNFGPRLISGETIDTKNGILYGKSQFWHLTEEEVIAMMSGKTGALFGISALSGALIGAGENKENAALCRALCDFAENCGIAFQLQDDILGITSTEEKLGKPIGSDIREGKATVLLLHAYQKANEEEKAFLRQTVGSEQDEINILKAREILLSHSLEYTENLAKAYLAKAEEALLQLPDSEWKDLLGAWRDFMLHREF